MTAVGVERAVCVCGHPYVDHTPRCYRCSCMHYMEDEEPTTTHADRSVGTKSICGDNHRIVREVTRFHWCPHCGKRVQ